MPLSDEIIQSYTTCKTLTELQSATHVTINLEREIYVSETTHADIADLLNELNNSTVLTSLTLYTDLNNDYDMPDPDNDEHDITQLISTIEQLSHNFLELGEKITRLTLGLELGPAHFIANIFEKLSQNTQHLIKLEQLYLEITNANDPAPSEAFDRIVALLTSIPHPNKLTHLNLKLKGLMSAEKFPHADCNYQESLSHAAINFHTFLGQCTELRSFSIYGNYLGHYIQDSITCLHQHKHLKSVTVNFEACHPNFNALNTILTNQNLTDLSINFNAILLFRASSRLSQEVKDFLNSNHMYQRDQPPMITQFKIFGQRIQYHTNLKNFSLKINPDYSGSICAPTETNDYIKRCLIIPLSKNTTIASLKLTLSFNDQFNYHSCKPPEEKHQKDIISYFRGNKKLEALVLTVTETNQAQTMEINQITANNKSNREQVLRLGNALIQNDSLPTKQAAQLNLSRANTKTLMLGDHVLLLSLAATLKSYPNTHPENHALITGVLNALFSKILHSKSSLTSASPLVASYLTFHDLRHLQQVHSSAGFFSKSAQALRLTQTSHAEDDVSPPAKRQRLA